MKKDVFTELDGFLRFLKTMSGTCIRKSNLKKESRDMGLMQGLNNITSGRVYSPIFTSHIVLCISPVGAISAYLINIKKSLILVFLINSFDSSYLFSYVRI